MVEREDACDDIATAKRNAESRLQSRDARRNTQVKRFSRWIAIGDGLLVPRDPSRKSLAHGDAKSGKQIEVHAVNVFRDQQTILANEKDDGIVRNHFLEAPGNNRKRFL